MLLRLPSLKQRTMGQKEMIKAMAIFEANNKMMLVEECAAFLNCHPKTVANRLHKKIIKGKFLGGKWHIPKIQFLDQIIEEFEETV